MGITESIILGIVQGLTEFLPVSSSGHLWIFESIVLNQKVSLPFDAFLHLMTLLAVLVFYRKRIWSIINNFFSPKGKKKEKIYAWKLALATVMTVPIALSLKSFIEYDLTKEIVGGMLLLTGFLVFTSDIIAPVSKKKNGKFSWKVAFFLGIVQSIAVIPGISRSGATIVFLMLCGIERKKAVEISFLVSIPTIFGAFLFLVPELKEAQFDWMTLLLGGIAAFAAGLSAIWVLLRYIETYWRYFAFWCFLVGGIVFFL